MKRPGAILPVYDTVWWEEASTYAVVGSAKQDLHGLRALYGASPAGLSPGLMYLGTRHQFGRGDLRVRPGREATPTEADPWVRPYRREPVIGEYISPMFLTG